MARSRGDEVKDAIMQASLDVFSEKGVVETYVRDISKRAGIRESTLYYYFSGKEDIINSISDEYNEAVLETFQKIIIESSKAEYIDLDTVSRAINIFTEGFLMKDLAIKYERIMRMELTRNAKIAEDYVNSTYITPVAFLEALMSFLNEVGYIRDLDNHILAETVVAMISFVFTKYLGIGDLTDDTREQYSIELQRFVQGFFRLITIQDQVKITDEIHDKFRTMALDHFPSVQQAHV